MRNPVIFLTAFLLAACVGNPPQKSEIAIRDLGELPAGTLAAAVPLATLEVRAAAWLDTPAQLYRLAYADATQRQAYANSRWAATPAALLERHLQRRFASEQAGGCRLGIALDELEQRFASPQSSRVVLEARAALLPARASGIAPLAQQTFRIEQAVPTPDARGGVAATRAAADALAQDLSRWLGELARSRPALVQQCKENQ